jgi:hypothetical protein
MVSVVMLAVIAGCAVLLCLKGTLMQGVTMVFNAIIAGFIAFGFFEMLARVLISYAAGVAIWAPAVCFALLFILTFAVLQTAVTQFSKEKADLGKLPEQIGRAVCGGVLGYLLTGYLLVAAAMAPLPSQYPYPRFNERSPNPAKPNKPMLSPDGFVTGLFATISKGSFSALRDPRSFAVLHADFIDQLYMNRLKAAQNVSLWTSVPALVVPRNGLWRPPDSLRDSENKPLSVPPGDKPMLVRVEIQSRALREAARFTFSQLRLVCGPTSGAKASLMGQGQATYPIGYIGANGRLERRPLNEIIALPTSGEPVTMDTAFAVPTHLTPLLLEFKRNNVAQVPPVASSEEAPQPTPLILSSGTPPAGAPAPAEEPKPAPRARPAEPEHEKDLTERTHGFIVEPPQ